MAPPTTLILSNEDIRSVSDRQATIWRHVGKGTFIGPRKLVEAPAISPSFSVDDVLQARMALEPQLAAQAAIHSTQDDVAEMEACLAEMKRALSMLHWKRLDERLHRAIAQATHNNLLLTLYDTLRVQMRFALDRRIDQVFGGEPGPKDDTDAEHRGVVEAIGNHDPQGAESAMCQALLRGSFSVCVERGDGFRAGVDIPSPSSEEEGLMS